MKKLIGTFNQILPLSGMAMHGAISDQHLRVIRNGGIVVENGAIVAIGNFNALYNSYPDIGIENISGDQVLIPGFIDCHTHICFAGSRARDYSMRIQGRSYLDIAQSGGGIWDSVKQTRRASQSELIDLLSERVRRHLEEGVTTIEVKSGYGLNRNNELKHLWAIREVDVGPADLVPTCLAAHFLPKDFEGTASDYLHHVLHDLLPRVKEKQLANRVDIFIEEGAFDPAAALTYLKAAKEMGFELTVHADQFSTGGSNVAIQTGAASADHLEACTEKEISLFSGSDTVAVVLPGASMGLGMPYASARKLLNANACVAIASDWNPGSAPMGDLLMQAAVMGAAEKLSTAEVFAGLTFRAAQALRITDKGRLAPGMIADMQSYDCKDYREILYHQGRMKPVTIWKNGKQLFYYDY